MQGGSFEEIRIFNWNCSKVCSLGHSSLIPQKDSINYFYSRCVRSPPPMMSSSSSNSNKTNRSNTHNRQSHTKKIWSPETIDTMTFALRLVWWRWWLIGIIALCSFAMIVDEGKYERSKRTSNGWKHCHCSPVSGESGYAKVFWDDDGDGCPCASVSQSTKTID